MTLRPKRSGSKRHRLPKFPASVAPTFKQLCEALPEEKLPELRRELEHCLEEMEAEARTNPQLDIVMAREIGSRCRFLLEHYREFTEEERSMAIGAIRYFAVADDPFCDSTFASGFTDDAKVINYTLQEIGIPGMFIELL